MAQPASTSAQPGAQPGAQSGTQSGSSAGATAGSGRTAAAPASIAWSSPEPQTPVQPCVSLPFTSPMLTVMRIRVAQHGGMEMLLSNPAGGRGIYVATWETLRAYAAPSLHDIVLAERIADRAVLAAPLAPSGVRAIALGVAVEGHAGRQVGRVAQRVQAAEQIGLRRLRAHLLLELARQMRLPGTDSELNDPWATDPDERHGWLAEAPRLLAPRFAFWPGCTPGELAAGIRRIAELAWPIGVGAVATRARLPLVLRLMSQTTRSGQAGVQMAQAINLHAVLADAALRHARGLVEDPTALLTAWRNDRAALVQALEQPDWLLDGWDRLCLLQDDPTAASALLHMLQECRNRSPMSRVEPDGFAPGASGGIPFFDRLARNEALRIRELQLADPEGAHDHE